LTSSSKAAGTAASAAGKNVEQFGRSSEKGAKGARRLNTESQAVGKALNALKALLPTVGVALFTQQVIAAGLAMTKMRNSLLAVTGSTAAANEELDFIRDTADRLGLSFQSLADSYVSFTAASKGTALEGDATRKIFVRVAESARVLGLSTDQTEGALRALQQMMSKGTVQAEELRGQLGERLPGAFQIAARAMGVSTQELGKMLEQGQVLAEDLLPKLADELEKTYGGALESATQSAGAAFGRLETALFSLRAEVAESGFMDGLADSTERLVDVLNSPGAIAAAQALGEALGFVAENLDIIGVALGAGFAAKMIRAGAGVKALGAAFAFLSGPVGVAALAAGGIATLVGVINEHKAAAEAAEAAQDEYSKAIEAGGDNAIEAAEKLLKARFAELDALSQTIESELAKGVYSDEDPRELQTRYMALQQEVIGLNKVLERMRANVEAGFDALGRMTDEGLGKFERSANFAVSELDKFIGKMREAAAVEAMTERQKAQLDAWNDAVKAGVANVSANESAVKALAGALYDEAAAREAARKATEEQAEAIREAEQARLDELSAMAEVEAAGWDQAERVRQMEIDKRIEYRQSLQENANALIQSLESESERIEREHDERLQILDQAQAEGLTIIGGYEQARARLREQTLEQLNELETDHAEEYRKIWDNMVEGMQSAFTDAIYDGLFEDGIDSFEDFTDTVKKLWKRMIAEMISAWLTSGITGMMRGEGFSGFNVGSFIGGGESSGGDGPGTSPITVATIGKKVAAWFGWGGGSTTSAVPGAVGSVKGPAVLNYAGGASSSAALGGQGAAAIGNGYGGGAVGGNAAASGAGAGWGAAAGAAFIAAIGVYGFGKQARKQRQRAERQTEFFSQVGTGTNEAIGESAVNFRGMLDESTAFFSATEAGWQSTAKALQEIGLLSDAWGASLDENGNALFRVQGNIDGARAALEQADATMYRWHGNFKLAEEKSNSLRVSVVGDADQIRAAMETAAAESGLSFTAFQETASGASAVLAGDLRKWDEILQGIVESSLSAVTGQINSAAGAASNLTREFERAAGASRSISVGSTINAASHYMGVARVPRDNYPANLHKGEKVLSRWEADDLERSLQVDQGGGDGANTAILIEIRDGVTRTAAAYEGMLREQRAVNRGRR
jgi:tape measure domain-containing protein